MFVQQLVKTTTYGCPLQERLEQGRDSLCTNDVLHSNCIPIPSDAVSSQDLGGPNKTDDILDLGRCTSFLHGDNELSRHSGRAIG